MSPKIGPGLDGYSLVGFNILQHRFGRKPHTGTLRDFACLINVSVSECAYLIELLAKEKYLRVRLYMDGVPHEVENHSIIQLIQNPALEITCL